MNNHLIGWDVGGAHLKAALLDADGNLQQVLQVPCALWRGLQELEVAIDLVLNTFGGSSASHAVTMTGELVDLFANRKEGVQSISRVMQAKLIGHVKFYTGTLHTDILHTGTLQKDTLHPDLSTKSVFSGFVLFNDVEDYWQYIASANWQASASFVASKVKCGLMIDIGSTTADFVLIENNQAACLGFTDATRLQSEELVYTGVVRTPLMAIAQKVQFKHATTSVAAEFFATTADVYRLTEDLLAIDDMAETADARDKSHLATARRIARMIGRDVEDASMIEWIGLAYTFKLQQLERLKNVASTHISRLTNHKNIQQPMFLVGAGAGSFLAREVAKLIAIPYIDVVDLISLNANENATNGQDDAIDIRRWASVCLPAYAVAYLAYHQPN